MIMKQHERSNLAFLNIFAGGVGAAAGRNFLRSHKADQHPFPQVSLCLDTDASTQLPDVESCWIPLSPERVSAMRANPLNFGPEVPIAIRELERLLSADDIENGSRTTRGMTQLSFILHRNHIARSFKKALHALRKQARIQRVMPVIVSSSGGGTGSASQILLMDLLSRTDFRQQLLNGVPDQSLLKPLSFVVEPFEFANRTSDMQAKKIIANAFAFRLESEVMLERGAVSYISHLGFANDQGTVLDDPELMARVLGTVVYEIERNWEHLKARWVDGPDDVASMANYSGRDSLPS